jgi:carbon-monoxide dehydrogenase small subunit
MTAATKIRMTVNGRPCEGSVEARKTLADFLREDLGLTGTHLGCEHGVCGACTILVDGEAVRACLMLAVQADGAEVTTVEGVASGDVLHPVQEAFWDSHSFQCGFCTPGFVMAAAWAVKTHGKDLTEAQVKAATAGNLCRCGTYPHVVRAALAAAKERQ